MPDKKEKRGARYAKHWTKEENDDKPVSLEKIDQVRKSRLTNYKEIAKDYYDLTTDNLESGWGPKFHFCPFPDPDETIAAAQCRHEHFLALMMQLHPGQRGLDAGCGCGGPSREMARFAGVHVTGISINKLHVDKATCYANEAGLSEQLDYIEADFMVSDLGGSKIAALTNQNIPFPDNTFDFVYATEATVYAPDLRAVYSEIARVLKPNGVFGVYEWLLTDKFDKLNPTHVNIRQRLERADGVTNLLTVPEGLAAFRASGLEMYHCEDMALRGTDAKRWWFAIAGQTEKTTCREDYWRVWRLRRGFFWGCYALTWCLEKAGLMREGRLEALRTQGMSVWSTVDAARLGIFTTSFMMVGRKPQ